MVSKLLNAVIVVPVYKQHPDKFEEISIDQLIKVLGYRPIRLVTYEDLNPIGYLKYFGKAFDFGLEYFPARYFKSPQTYNHLLRSIHFFKRFDSFSHLLMYHTDSFVFRDELNYWVEQDYDYIGAPLYEYDGTIRPKKLIGVGNGGFSLHKIPSALMVLNSFKIVYSYRDIIKKSLNYNWKGKVYYAPYFLRLLLGIGTNSHYLLNNSRLNEDIFWGIYVPRALLWYNVPNKEVAMKFSLEYNCEQLYIESGKKLPFGCHQWYKGEFLNFWKDKIELQGYVIP